jgi:DNA-binding XRE family transcriptional regulator/mannose-6-phosphate isomerase-like protein (cupin superfamily)
VATPSSDKLARVPETKAADPSLEIGRRLADLRARRGLQVSALARTVQVSPSLISQIERGRSRPSVSTLFALAEALEVPVDAFFRPGLDELGDEPATPPPVQAPTPSAGLTALQPSPADDELVADRYVVRRGERATIDIEGGVRWERLLPDARPDVEFMELEYGPGAESNPTPYRHPGVEMLVVLSGRLEISVGFELFSLEPGDSLCFPSTMPHRYVNPTDVVARAITVILPDGTAPGPKNDRRP